MNDSENSVECGVHGTKTATYVCQHLIDGEKLGFNCGYDPDDPHTLYPDAWCDACEQTRESAGGWNDESEAFANVKLLCSACYEAARERNWIQDEEAYQELVDAAFQYLKDKQQAFLDEFRIDDYERWNWDQETGKLVFSHQGQAQLEADIDFVGSFSTHTDTWMWAWANDSLTERVRTASQKIRELGEQHGFMRLAAAHWDATGEDGWEMTAIMAKHLNAMGAYRTPGDHGYTYMVISQARRAGKG